MTINIEIDDQHGKENTHFQMDIIIIKLLLSKYLPYMEQKEMTLLLDDIKNDMLKGYGAPK